jgi:hypothetical protein
MGRRRISAAFNAVPHRLNAWGYHPLIFSLSLSTTLSSSSQDHETLVIGEIFLV